MVLPALREENLAKNWGRKRQKICSAALPSRREKKSLKRTFEKGLNQSKNPFLKSWNTMFDWSKNKFDQSNQAEAHRIFKARFRLIEN